MLETSKVKIFRPNEITRIINAIPKSEDKTRFETLLYTGAHYSEIQRLYENASWYKGDSVKIPNVGNTNHRVVHLSKQGKRIVNLYIFGCKKGLPHYVTWEANLKRWCSYAKIENPDKLSIKSIRGTWEAWLVAKYPDKIFKIFQNQGHREFSTLERYSKLNFSDEDLDQMEAYVAGWL